MININWFNGGNTEKANYWFNQVKINWFDSEN